MANTKSKTTTNVGDVVSNNTETTSSVAVSGKSTTKAKRVIPLQNDDELVVTSVIPHVSYKDSKNNDFYTWEDIGHEEKMSYSAIKDMWRNSKSYFKNMWLKLHDDRIIKEFGLVKTYESYDFLMDAKSYTKANNNEIESKIQSIPKGLRETLIKKLKNLIINGDVSDAQVIRNLEKLLNVDLLILID